MSKKRTIRKDRIASFVRLLVLGCVLCVTLVTFIGQQNRLSDLNEEHSLLIAKLEQLKLEEEKRKRLLDFTQTADYIEQFARDKLGLVKKDDIKFVAPTPTATPAETDSLAADGAFENTQTADGIDTTPTPAPIG